MTIFRAVIATAAFSIACISTASAADVYEYEWGNYQMIATCPNSCIVSYTGGNVSVSDSGGGSVNTQIIQKVVSEPGDRPENFD